MKILNITFYDFVFTNVSISFLVPFTIKHNLVTRSSAGLMKLTTNIIN